MKTNNKKGKTQCNARISRDMVLVARVEAAKEGLRLGQWLEKAIMLKSNMTKAAKKGVECP